MLVVLLHGLACSTRSFDRLAPLLRVEGHEVVAVDLPGHGGDAENPGADSIAEMAGHVRDLVAAPATFLGHSMGGLVACAVAEQDPRLARRVVCVNSPPTYESRLTARSGPERALRVRGLGPLLWRGATPERTREGLRTAFATGDVPDLFVEDARRLSWSTFVRATTAVDEYVLDAPLDERLRALDVPFTVVFGMRDRRVDPATTSRFDAVIEIGDAGHTPIWEAPEAIAAALK